MLSPSTDILSVLSQQHDQIDKLIARLFAARGDREKMFLELASLVAAHVAVETQVFFPRLMRESSDLRQESMGESIALKRHVGDMLGLHCDGDDAEEFDLKLGQFADRFHKHAHAFERDMLFPVLSEIMDDDERQELGRDSIALYDQLAA